MPVQILVADDSVTMRRILELTFAGEDAEVTTVASGDAALEEARRLKPAVLFADCSMTGMDGYALAQAVKGAGGLEDTAVIAMASQKVPYDEAKGKAAGVDDHIVKPFDTQHVIDRVNQVLSRPRAQAEMAASPAIQSPVSVPARPATPAVPSPAASMAPSVPSVPARPAATSAAAPAVSAPAANVGGAVAAATATDSDLATKLKGLGLTADQLDGVLSLSREVVEQVVWEVVPDLAERLIKEEIARLTSA